MTSRFNDMISKNSKLSMIRHAKVSMKEHYRFNTSQQIVYLLLNNKNLSDSFQPKGTFSKRTFYTLKGIKYNHPYHKVTNALYSLLDLIQSIEIAGSKMPYCNIHGRYVFYKNMVEKNKLLSEPFGSRNEPYLISFLFDNKQKILDEIQKFRYDLHN